MNMDSTKTQDHRALLCRVSSLGSGRAENGDLGATYANTWDKSSNRLLV